MATPTISVVIPCRNEADNLAFLLDEVDSAMLGRAYEVIVVDDGSTDSTSDVLAGRIHAGKPLRHIRHDRSSGQSAALRSGVFAARGQIVVTMDGDGQNNPAYLPALADALINAGPAFGIAAGQRLKRTDTKLKQLSSRFANNLRGAILKDKTRDSGCGLKALHTELFRQLPFLTAGIVICQRWPCAKALMSSTSMSLTANAAMANPTTAFSTVACAAFSTFMAYGGCASVARLCRA